MARLIEGSAPAAVHRHVVQDFANIVSITDPVAVSWRAGSRLLAAALSVTAGALTLFLATLPTVPACLQLWTGYWAGLNIQRAYPYPSPPGQGSNKQPQPAGAGGGGDGLSSSAVIAIAVSCSVGGLLAVVGLLVVWARLRSSSWIYSGPPKCGPNTTIVVTDIESSTLLW